MKVVTVIGARPQFIKAAVVSRELSRYEGASEVIIHTGQHFDKNMSEVFFEQMGIPRPTHQLDVSSLSHGAMTGRMLEQIESLLFSEQPDWVVVYGDTNSTLAGALAASKLHIKVAHIEAGLRSFNMRMPEEQNRVLTDRISKALFCPTDVAVRNLAKEGFTEDYTDIINCGDVMFDAALYYEKVCRKPVAFEGIEGKPFILATMHRAENTDSKERMQNIIEAINEINRDIPVVIPIHPRTKKMLSVHGLRLEARCIEPVGYLEMIYLIKNSRAVLTDSGGLQKEAYFFGKKCLTFRDETEWVELVVEGANSITGANRGQILREFEKLKAKGFDFSSGSGLYGDGNAASKIVSYLLGRMTQ